MNTASHLPHSAAAERNGPPIHAALRAGLGGESRILEIASGTGQHAACFAALEPGWRWQPTEADAALLPAIAERCAGCAGVAPPALLDLLAPPWPAGLRDFDAAFAANLLHIAPWSACEALMRCAAGALGPRGWLLLYGPFLVDGAVTAPSNLAFDADLRARNPAWGLRRLTEVEAVAARSGFGLHRRQEMPANNLLLWFRRSEALGG